MKLIYLLGYGLENNSLLALAGLLTLAILAGIILYWLTITILYLICKITKIKKVTFKQYVKKLFK